MSEDLKIIRACEGGILSFHCPACGCSHGVNSGWTFNGDFDRPTFSPSIKVSSYEVSPEGKAMFARGERPPDGHKYPGKDTVCHSHVTDGKIRFESDCTHALAGLTIALEPF